MLCINLYLIYVKKHLVLASCVDGGGGVSPKVVISDRNK